MATGFIPTVSFGIGVASIS